MKPKFQSDYNRFYSTSPQPCPYIKGQTEQRIFTELRGSRIQTLYDDLSCSGFRRSQDVCYIPACADCKDCIAVRVITDEFSPSASQTRCIKKNKDLISVKLSPSSSYEQYALFKTYQEVRHNDSEMLQMSFKTFQNFVEKTPVDTKLVEFRLFDNRLMAVCLFDRVSSGFSAVYSFYDPFVRGRGLGNYMILWLILESRKLGLPFVYLGYWIKRSQKMSYKEKFQPLEYFTPEGWKRALV